MTSSGELKIETTKRPAEGFGQFSWQSNYFSMTHHCMWGPLDLNSCLVTKVISVTFLWFGWRQSAAGRSLKIGSCRGDWGWTIFANGAIRRLTQWPWIEHPTFRSRGGNYHRRPDQVQVPIRRKSRVRWSDRDNFELTTQFAFTDPKIRASLRPPRSAIQHLGLNLEKIV